MRKYKGNLIGAAFNRELNRAAGGDCICGTCHHHNGECEDFARAGKCKAYDKHGAKMREPVIRCTECMAHFFSEDELVKARETSYATGRIDYRLNDDKALINTEECWEQVIDACPYCMTDEFLLDLKEDKENED